MNDICNQTTLCPECRSNPNFRLSFFGSEHAECPKGLNFYSSVPSVIREHITLTIPLDDPRKWLDSMLAQTNDLLSKAVNDTTCPECTKTRLGAKLQYYKDEFERITGEKA